MEYENAGVFRRELAQKILMAQTSLARAGFSTGGRPPYGFRRWLAASDGTPVRQLEEGERVRMAGHHVVWLPGPEEELAVIRRILQMLGEMPASRVGKILTEEGVLTPDAGRYRTDNGVRHQTSGVWHQTTIASIARNPLLLAIATYGRRSMGDQLRFTPDGPRELTDSDYHVDESPKVIRNPAGEQIEAPAKFDPLVELRQHMELLETLDKRAGTQRGKPRSRNPAENPLGSRIFDMNCTWSMYRTPYGKGFKYKCGLYQQTGGQECAHNHVDGPLATRFMLGVVQQRMLSPGMLPRLEERLRRMAAKEGDEKPDDLDDVAKKRMEAGELERQLDVVGGNLARAKNPAQYEAIAKNFDELKAKQKRLEEELSALESRASDQNDLEGEIRKVLAAAEALTELCSQRETLELAGQIFGLTNARLFLRFKPVPVKKRVLNKVSGGVVTLGDADPPISIYEGPTGRRKLTESGSLGNDSKALDHCSSGQEGESLRNVSRGDSQRGLTETRQLRPEQFAA
jgi:hypothetical protein